MNKESNVIMDINNHFHGYEEGHVAEPLGAEWRVANKTPSRPQGKTKRQLVEDYLEERRLRNLLDDIFRGDPDLGVK